MVLDGTFVRLKELLLQHEGLRLKPYKDTVGKISIGCGRNLTDVGISKLEAFSMLDSDIKRVIAEATIEFPWFNSLSSVRQDAFASMIFNLGLEGIKRFQKLCLALQNQNYETAATEMLDSQWAKQVGQRANDLAHMMRNDSYPSGF